MTKISEERLHEWAGQLAHKHIPEDWEHVSSSGTGLVALNRKCDLYFKVYFPRSKTTAVKRTLKGGRLQRAAKSSELLQRFGIDTPLMVLHGTLPRGGEYVFMHTAEGCNLFDTLQSLAAEGQTAIPNKRKLLTELGTFLGRVHATGFVHGNPSAHNIIVCDTGDRFRFTLINVDQCKRQNPLAGRRILQDLRALNTATLPGVTATDRLRFLRAWRQQMRHLSATDIAILLDALERSSGPR